MEVSFPLDSDGFIDANARTASANSNSTMDQPTKGSRHNHLETPTIAHCVASLPVLTHGGRKLNWN